MPQIVHQEFISKLTKVNLLIILSYNLALSQTAKCNGLLPFEEKNGFMIMTRV
jgi:hypothetical protein